MHSEHQSISLQQATQILAQEPEANAHAQSLLPCEKSEDLLEKQESGLAKEEQEVLQPTLPNSSQQEIKEQAQGLSGSVELEATKDIQPKEDEAKVLEKVESGNSEADSPELQKAEASLKEDLFEALQKEGDSSKPPKNEEPAGPEPPSGQESDKDKSLVKEGPVDPNGVEAKPELDLKAEEEQKEEKIEERIRQSPSHLGLAEGKRSSSTIGNLEQSGGEGMVIEEEGQVKSEAKRIPKCEELEAEAPAPHQAKRIKND